MGRLIEYDGREGKTGKCLTILLETRRQTQIQSSTDAEGLRQKTQIGQRDRYEYATLAPHINTQTFIFLFDVILFTESYIRRRHLKRKKGASRLIFIER